MTAPRVVLFVAVGTLLLLLFGALAIDFFANRGRGDVALYLTALGVLILTWFFATILLVYLRSAMP